LSMSIKASNKDFKELKGKFKNCRINWRVGNKRFIRRSSS